MSELVNNIVSEANRRLFEESVPRIKKCLNVLSEDEVWQRPNDSLSSVGNLVLHLYGNVTQWIGSGLGKQPDSRTRNWEFAPDTRVSKEELLQRLSDLETNTRSVLGELDEAALLATHSVQGFEEKGTSILIHVVEHFSYHTGQITWHTKLLKNTDLGYYEGRNLNEKSQ